MSTLHTEDERNGYINDISSNSLDSLAIGNGQYINNINSNSFNSLAIGKSQYGFINNINSNSLNSLAIGNCKLYYYWGANLRIIDNRHSLDTGQNH